MQQVNTKNDGWSPYLAGALLGLLAIASVYATIHFLGKTSYLGASTTFVRAAGILEQKVNSEHVAGNEYFKETKIKVDWQFMLVLGIFLGALISSTTDNSFKIESVPPTWEDRFGPSIGKRAAGAFFGIGWAIMGFCPGTSVGALGEGRWHAVFAIMGMIVVAAIYAELYPFFKSTVLAWKDFGKVGLPDVIGVSHWVIVPIFWVGVIALFILFEKKKI